MQPVPDSSNRSPVPEPCGRGPSPDLPDFSAEERRFLLQLAREAVSNGVAGGPDPENFGDVPPRLAQKAPCFVTLTKGGALRGCIGNLLAETPLYQAVMENARGAATRDPRFAAVQAAEVSQLRIEISLLTTPRPLAFTSPEDLLAKLRPNVDGVVLKIGSRGATYLPQVWDQIPDKAEFLGHLCQKASCAPNAWRDPGTEILVYQVEAFHEADPGVH